MKAPRLHRFLVGWYPAPWRERYGTEFLALLEERPPGLRQALDIVSAALDARIHPQLRPGPLLAASPPVAPEVRLPGVPPRSYGVVPSPSAGAMSRRAFMRRMVGAGAALLSLEFLGGTLAFLWPQFRSGLGAKFRLGRLADIVVQQPSFANGWPFSYTPARAFLVNVPAAKELALGRDASIPDPSADQLLALWRKCPHLGCQVPSLCEELKRFTCRCHGSTYNIIGEKLKEGPAERGMDRFALEIDEDGMVVIDTAVIVAGAPNLGQEYLTFMDPFPYDIKCE
ncbi:MAG TPA: Rieske 2Fe-2S domain-containing protein [Candidatus Limnocylindria bacterium]|jgi:Rieske Fe-S protein